MDQTLGDIPSEAVVAELERLCGSAIFKNSLRLCRFLRYTVEAALRGRGESLKEYTIGTEVYDRGHPYHPSQDSIVRTEALRLRNKLKDYYATEGVQDEILIYYRSGSYQPVFRRNVRADGVTRAPAAPVAVSSDTALPGVTIAVLPFKGQGGDPETVAIAAGITDDLVFRIAATEGCRVVAPQSVTTVQAEVQDLATMSVVLKADQIITGSVRKSGAHIRVSVTGVHPSGLETWSQRFDFTTDSTDALILEEQTASAILSRIAPQRTILRHMQSRVPSVCLSGFPEMISAEALLDEGTASSAGAALAKFTHLAVRQPDSARIQCGIARCYYALALLGQNLPSAQVQKAKEAAEKAMELDPEMGEAHAAMGCSLALERKYQSAEQAFRAALTMRASPATRHVYADLLMSFRRFDEAAIQLWEARHVDPFSCKQRVSSARLRYLTWQSNNRPQSLSEEIRFGRIPEQVSLFQAELFLRMGDKTNAITAADALLRNSDQASATVSDIAAIFALAGSADRAHSLIDRFQLLSQDTPVSKIYQARLCGALRDERGCRSMLELAVFLAEPQLCWLETDPKFEDLRGRSYYKHTLAKLDVPSESDHHRHLTVS